MTTQLDPTILRKLGAFSQRRRKLILLRGVAAALATLLATMMLVALVDWLFILRDWQRWTLSGLAYSAVILAEWRACVRLLLHAPDARELARLIEHAEPELREDLISAVELAETDSAFDSRQFRSLVQANVANRIQGVDMDRLLPVQLLRRTLAIAAVVIACCIAAFALSGAQLGTLLMRAMLPMANVARVSKVKVQIVEPTPANAVVPQGDSVPLVIQVSGPRTTKATLETFTVTGGRQLIPMTVAGEDRFHASLHVGREDVLYRVRAGDAITEKFHLRAAARPHVARFHKTFHLPEYTKAPRREVTEEHGDLIALEGTEVDLQIETDQPVRAAELRLEQGKERLTVPLAQAENGRLTARLPLTTAGVYRVYLIAAATGFENKFSPEYEMRPEPDLVPQIEMEFPRQDLIVPANDMIDILGWAKDDQGLARVGQMIRINDGKWQEVTLGAVAGTEAKVERRWDLIEQGVRPGDLVATKLVAVDTKGSRAESQPIQITITSAGFEAKRLQELAAQRRFLEQMKLLRGAADTLDKRSREAREQFERAGEDASQRRQAALLFTAMLDEFEGVASETTAQLHALIQSSKPGYTTGSLVVMARLLARMNAGAVMNARHAVLAVSSDPAAGYARDLIRESADAAARGAQRARLAYDSYRTLLTAASVDVLAQNVFVVAREQDRIAVLAEASGASEAKWSSLAGRLRVILSEMRGLEELMASSAEEASDNAPDRFRRYHKDLEKQRVAVESVFAAEKAGEKLLKPLKELTRITGELRRRTLEFRRDFSEPPRRVFQAMLQETQQTSGNFEKLRTEADALARNGQIPDEPKAALVGGRWEAKAQLFKAHGDVEEVRPDSDTYFVNDVRATTLALGQLKEAVLAAKKPLQENKEVNESFNALDQGFRVLEAGHSLAETFDTLTRLASAERWEIATLPARTENPREWEWIERRLRALPDELRQIRPANEAAKKIVQEAQKILWESQRLEAWQQIEREMQERFKAERTPEPRPEQLERVAFEVKRALDLLRIPMMDARELIAGMTPKLGERMAQLAKEAGRLEEKSREQTEKADAKPPEQAQADARQQLAAQQQLNEKVEVLKDAIRSDANQQSMLEKEGRERARDADDALAMLKEPPTKAAAALAEASAAMQSETQKAALEAAAAEQEKLASALDQLAKHYDALEKGAAEESRLALREKEEALGIKQALEQQYAKAEQMEQMAKASPEELLKQLEAALPQNPQMQQELSQIAKNTLDIASGKLSEASQRESAIAQEVEKLAEQQQANAAREAMAQAEVANTPKGDADPNTPGADLPTPPQNLAQNAQQPPDAKAGLSEPSEGPVMNDQPAAPHPQLTQAANQQTPIAQATTQAGSEVARAGRHEQRLQNTAQGRQLEQLGKEIQETAHTEVAQARERLSGAAEAAPAQAAVNAASNELQKELGQLAQAQNSEAAPMQNNHPPTAASEQQSQEMAQATSPSPPPGNATPAPAPGEAPPGTTPPPPLMPSGHPTPTGQMAAVSPQEQVWMARTLDSLDAALNSPKGSAEQGQGAEQSAQTPGQQPGAMAQAQQSMSAAAQAAAAAMRASRNQQSPLLPSSVPGQGQPSKSDAGLQASTPGAKIGALPEAKVAKTGDWGKLPKKVAEQLTQGQQETVAGDYRNQVETYYRVIAERAKKP